MARRKTRKKKNHSYDLPAGLLARAFKWALVLGLWTGLAVAALCAWYATELPGITRSVKFERKPAIIVKAADGSVIARYGDLVGDALQVKDLPPHLVQAVLAIEDRRFYSHFGLDPLGLARAMVVNATQGGVVQGGSTITQQLAKNLFLSQERTFKRKVQEAMLALWLEYELSKDEILSAYLNRVYMGSGAYGVDAAARIYFNKNVRDLDLRECATLAGLFKAPSRFSPLNNPRLAHERADVVLQAMADAGYIGKDEATGLTRGVPLPMKKPTGGGTTRYFTDWVVDGLDDLIGAPGEDIIVQTTFDPRLQAAAEKALQEMLATSGKERAISQGAVTVMRPDGTVVAMVGGADYALSQFNRATQGQRQPGSSFKPVVYLAALENGWSPDDIILDAPFDTGRYRPENFGGEYFGEVPLWAALMMSMNTAAVRLMQDIGPAAAIDTARRLGIISTLQPDLSLALGSSGLSMLELTTAYAVMANGGYSVFPYAITEIRSADTGTLYYQRAPAALTRQVVSAGPLQELRFMLQNVIEQGTGQRARLGYPAYGKTGTSQESRDAWFAGFTDELVTTVWVGNDDNSPMKKVTGGSFPADIWRATMTAGRGLYAPIGPGDFQTASSDGGFEGLLGRLLSAPAGDQTLGPAPPGALPDENILQRFGTPQSRANAEDHNARQYND